jgi:hypothetical protein
VLLVAFVLPGFVTVLLQERTFKSADDPTPFDRLLRAVYYSLWCYLLLAGVALYFGVNRMFIEALFDAHKGAPAELVWRGALALLGPAAAVWAATLIWQESGANNWVLSKLPLFNERHQRPTAWDYWFRKGSKTYVRVIYADGNSVWGYYGEESFASYAKDGLALYLEQIFRERVVKEDEENGEVGGPWFGPRHPFGRGAWVNVDDAVSVEFYAFDDDQPSPTPVVAASVGTPRQKGGAARTEEHGSEDATSAPGAAPAEED